MRPSVCFVHDWLVDMRGGEKVLEALMELFPEAPIYTLFVNRKILSPAFERRAIHPSFLQYIPGITRLYRWLLPLFPLAIRTINVSSYDLVISSSHCVAKAVRVGKNAVHLCYCHTPMRYLWGFEEVYFGKFHRTLRSLIQFYFAWLKKWDVRTSEKVQHFIANSKNTAKRIQDYYGCRSTVIHPPVEQREGLRSREGKYYLIVSALVPYKRIDLAIEAFNRMKLSLKIVGSGPLRSELESLVKFRGIEFLGALDQVQLWDLYAQSRALIFPGEEDFGIVPVEAQMFGKPVIAYGKGGILDTVLAYNDPERRRSPDQSTGFFFYEQNPQALIQALHESERLQFNPEFIRSHARQFSKERFQREITNMIAQTCPELNFVWETKSEKTNAYANAGVKSK